MTQPALQVLVEAVYETPAGAEVHWSQTRTGDLKTRTTLVRRLNRPAGWPVDQALKAPSIKCLELRNNDTSNNLSTLSVTTIRACHNIGQSSWLSCLLGLPPISGKPSNSVLVKILDYFWRVTNSSTVSNLWRATNHSTVSDLLRATNPWTVSSVWQATNPWTVSNFSWATNRSAVCMIYRVHQKTAEDLYGLWGPRTPTQSSLRVQDYYHSSHEAHYSL